jgi:hydrogenase/urease accessory protein HupE
LRGRDAEIEIPERQAKGQVLTDYFRLGFEHILTGPDHLAFVLGLMLLVAGRRRLIQTITAFTLGHSVTLSLAALGLTRVAPGPVEFAIALSVLMLALEVARPVSDPPGAMRRRPWLVASTFGLLHGMGFAGALTQVGLPGEEIPLALFSFNIGIEFGQIVFVLGVLLAARLARGLVDRLPPWRSRGVAYAIGSMATFWCLERASELF